MKTDALKSWLKNAREDLLEQAENTYAYISTFSDADDCTDIYITEEFESMLSVGAITPSDGDGYYMLDDKTCSNVSVWEYGTPEWATHVAWYNK